MAKEEKNEYGVYSKLLAGRRKKYDKEEGMYDKKHSEILEEDSILSERFVKEMNSNFKGGGIYYELDEAKTKKYREELKTKLGK